MTRPFKAWTDLGALPRAAWSLVLASFINRLGAMALPFLTLYLIRSVRLDVETAGAILVLYGAVAMFAGPVAGVLCDRFGAARVMLGSLAASGLLLCVYPLARSVGTLTLLTAAWSLSAEIFRPANMVRLTAAVPAAQRKQAFALYRFAINLGMSVGPAAAGFLAEWSFRAIFVVDGVTSLFAAAALVLLQKPEATPSDAPAQAKSRFPFRALGDPKLALALGALLPLATLFFQTESSVPVLLVQDRHFATTVFGAMFTLNTVIIVVCEIPLNATLAAWPHRRILVLGAAFGAVGFFGVALAPNVVALAGATVLWTIGEMLYSPTITTYIAEIAPSDRRGEYMGLYTMTYSVAFIAAPWGGLLALDRLGPRGLAIAMLATGALSAVLFTRFGGAPAPAVTTESAAPPTC